MLISIYVQGLAKIFWSNNVRVIGYNNNRVKLNDWHCMPFAKIHIIITKDVIGLQVGPSLDLPVAKLVG